MKAGHIFSTLLLVFGLATAPTFAAAQEPLPSLFGFIIGQKLVDRSELLPVNEDETSFIYTRRQSRNKEYSLQNVGLSKLTSTSVRIFGTATHRDIGSCRRQEFEIITQLRSRYPSIHDKVEEANGTVNHILAYERPSCSFIERAGSTTFRVPCSSNFHVYCQAESNRLFITTQDTEYSKLARDEAVGFIQRSPRRNQLD